MSNYKLLLADDSVTIQKVVNLIFADEGIEVITVGDGDSALERLAEMTPDLVLADVNMPGVSGYEICARLKANEATRDVPVMLLVGSFEPFDEEEAARVGADDYLTKPFQSIRQLVNKVTDLLNRRSGTQPAVEQPEAEEPEAEEPEAEEPEAVELEADEPKAEQPEAEEPEAEEPEAEESFSAEPAAEEPGIPETEPAVPAQAGYDEELPAEAVPFSETPGMDVPEPEPASEVVETAAKPAPELGDAGMDDEMIEANRLGDSFGEEPAPQSQDEPVATETVGFGEKGFATVGFEEPRTAAYPEVPVAELPVPELSAAEAPVSIDEKSDFLELPPLVEETGIMAFDGARPEPAPVEKAPAVPAVSSELVEAIARRVAEKLAERVLQSIDEAVPEVTDKVVQELWEEGRIG